jgi:phospholipase C
VYDLLARNYVVCDKWFSSVPGATWPNRLYSMTGQAPKRDNQKLPLYTIPSFVRHLDDAGVSWRWYVHEKLLLGPVGTIDCADGSYTTARNVFFYDPHFFDDVREGRLPAVSWIDPNFVDMGGLKGANDDHPAADIRAGQALVQSVVQALSNSDLWSKTLLVITYDEHGGFFDHVAPGPAAGPKPFDRYGVRVPAIIVSPWVAQGRPESTIFDHTSIIKTVLLRFCRDQAGRIPDMGPRVAAANHLGALLTEDAARPPLASDRFPTATAELSQHVQAFRMRVATARERPPLNDFQEGWLRARPQLEQRRL